MAEPPTNAMLQVVIETIHARPRDTRLVFLSDFDGTLADFHDNPVLPWPTRKTQRLLARAGRTIGHVVRRGQRPAARGRARPHGVLEARLLRRAARFGDRHR